MPLYISDYKHRVLRGAKDIKEVELNKKKRSFRQYLEKSPSAGYYQITDKDEICITNQTKKVLAAINDIANNDKSALDEKDLFTFEDENIDVGCYVRFDGFDWLVVFKEHQSIDAKMHFIIRKCNNYFRVRYKGEIYKIPVSIENLTMYSDGIADNLYLSFMDSKKQIWYGSNPLTRGITEGFRVLLTHRTAFRITHINDFEYNGLIKSLVLQTAVINGDDIDSRMANNEDYYRNKFSENNEDSPTIKKEKIIGCLNLLPGEESEYYIKSSKPVTWVLDENKAFSIKSMSDENIVISANFNARLVGTKAVLKAVDPDKNVIDQVELVLRR